MRRRTDVARLRRVNLIRCFHPDIVISRGVSGLYVGYAVSRWRNAALVYNEHKQIGLKLSVRREAMLRYMCPRVDRIVVVAEGQRAEWIERGSDPGKTIVVPNGVETNLHCELRDIVRAELSLDPSAIVVLFAARLRPEKRALDFVNAVERAHALEPRIRGIIAGDGPERHSIEAAVNRSTAVRMIGHCNDVPKLLSSADMLAVTSEYEALPMVILEAMAAGVPVIASHVGDIPRAVSHGETGILFPPGQTQALTDAVITLSRDQVLRQELGSTAREKHREKWDISYMVDGYAAVLGSVRDDIPKHS